MNNTLYYGEIAALISAKIHQNPNHILRVKHTLSTAKKSDTLWAFCADAANVFDKIDDLSGDCFINSHHALDHYPHQILDVLLSGTIPSVVDMVSISANSIKNTL